MSHMKHTADAWMDRIWDGLDYRKKYGRENEWSLLEGMYDNLRGSGADTGPNLIQEMGDALLSRLGVDDASVGISPSNLDPSSVDSYPIVQAVDNWLMKKLMIPDSARDAILHAYLWGRGFLKVGYDSEWGFDAAMDIGKEAGFMGMTLSQFNKQGMAIEHGPAKPGMPWVMPVLPHDIVVPWGVSKLRWTPWIAHRIIRHIDLLKQDPKYTKTKDLQPNMSMQDVMQSYLKTKNRTRHTNTGKMSNREQNGKPEFVELWEIRSVLDRRVITISETAVHRNDVDYLQVGGLPFTSLTFVQHPRAFWSTPQAEYLRYHQAEQNDISNQASKQRRMNNYKLLIRKGMLSDTEKEKATSPESGLFIEAEQAFDPRVDLTPIPQSHNFELYHDAEQVRGNAREAVGFGRNQLGEFDASSRRTATEAGLVNQGSAVRTDFRASRVSTMYEDVFKIINNVIFTYWKTPRKIRLVDNTWPQFTGEDIAAEYSYEIGFGISSPNDKEARRQEAMNIYLTLREDPLVNQMALREFLTRRYADIEFGMLFTQENANANIPNQVP